MLLEISDVDAWRTHPHSHSQLGGLRQQRLSSAAAYYRRRAVGVVVGTAPLGP